MFCLVLRDRYSIDKMKMFISGIGVVRAVSSYVYTYIAAVKPYLIISLSTILDGLHRR